MSAIVDVTYVLVALTIWAVERPSQACMDRFRQKKAFMKFLEDLCHRGLIKFKLTASVITWDTRLQSAWSTASVVLCLMTQSVFAERISDILVVLGNAWEFDDVRNQQHTAGALCMLANLWARYGVHSLDDMSTILD
ncbi:hypothetical protein HDU93_009919, partial [Gonapodya sp. JEL0774]